MKNRFAAGALCAVAGLALTASGAHAALITFIYTGVASGTLDGANFGAAAPVPYTITATADTTSVFATGSGFRVSHATASIELAGVATVDVVTTTSTAVNQNTELVVFGNVPQDLALIIDSSNAAFGSWDMQSSIGPFVLSSNILQWHLGPLQTSGGELQFAGQAGAVGTFQAIVVPTPAASAVLACAGLGVIRRRRH